MNLIFCNECCAYQADGYCTLENAMPISSTSNKNCCFFMPKANTAFIQKKRDINI